jgi:hypothetical protein
MRRQVLPILLLAAAATLPAMAQDRRGYGRDDRGYGYGGYGRNDRDFSYGYGRQSMGGNPVRATMRDLEMIFQRSRVDSHEADHFRRALRELADFDRDARRGRFDRGSLNSALDNMGDLARAHQLHPRDRQLIRQRMNDLRYLGNSGRY